MGERRKRRPRGNNGAGKQTTEHDKGDGSGSDREKQLLQYSRTRKERGRIDNGSTRARDDIGKDTCRRHDGEQTGVAAKEIHEEESSKERDVNPDAEEWAVTADMAEAEMARNAILTTE